MDAMAIYILRATRLQYWSHRYFDGCNKLNQLNGFHPIRNQYLFVSAPSSKYKDGLPFLATFQDSLGSTTNVYIGFSDKKASKTRCLLEDLEISNNRQESLMNCILSFKKSEIVCRLIQTLILRSISKIFSKPKRISGHVEVSKIISKVSLFDASQNGGGGRCCRVLDDWASMTVNK